MKPFVLPVVFSFGLLAGAPALADSDASVEVKAGSETNSSRTFGDRVKALFGFGSDKGNQVADKTDKAKDKAQEKSKHRADQAKDEAQGQSEAAREHAAEAKLEGQAKAGSAKEEGSNRQGANESAVGEGNNRQGGGLGLGADVKIETRGKDK